MKHVLCYGDSNTWGSLSHDGRLFDDKQWTQILATKLGPDYRVLQEGLCGRFAGELESGEEAFKNGQTPFEAVYRSATPVCVLVIALGTNDLKKKYSRSANKIYQDIMWYADKAEELNKTNEGEKVNIIVLAPTNFISNEEYFFAEPSLREELLEEFMECKYPVIMMSELELTDDGVHYSENDHEKIAQAVYGEIKELGL